VIGLELYGIEQAYFLYYLFMSDYNIGGATGSVFINSITLANNNNN